MQEFGEDLSSAAGAAATRLGTNFMGVANTLKAGIRFRKAAEEGADGDAQEEMHAESAAEVRQGLHANEIGLSAGIP